MAGGYFDEHGNFVLTAAASDGDASPSGMSGENDGVHPHEKNNKRGENDERDNASEDGTETQHDDAAEPAAVRDASESDSDIDIAAFAAAADGESAHMGSGVPESSGDAAFTDGANKEHIGNADGYSDGHGEYSDGEKDDPSDADGEKGRGGKNGKHRPFPLLPVTFITLGVTAVLVVVIYCMQRFDLFESGNADVADTTAATTATVPDTTELPAGSVRMPDLTGKTRDDAEAELARAGYKGEPIYCGSYSYTADENTVLEQFPAKNIIFNAEDAVELTISLGRAPDTMPDITTLTEKDAFKRLSSLGYNVTVLSAYSDVAAEGTVDMQSVAPGTKIESGTDMFIVTSLGPKPTDFVEITGMSLGAGNLTVESGSTDTLTVTFTPDNATEHGIWWHSDDPSKVEDPSLIIYAAVREHGSDLIITNGDQTDTIVSGLEQGLDFSDSLRSRCFEPDAPNLTPRISAMLCLGGDYHYDMSILKSIDEDGSDCARYTYAYPAKRGLGHFIHTYVTDGDPLPTFQGEPERVRIPNGIDAFTDDIWNALDEDNRISLYVRYTDLTSGEKSVRLINRNK
jgi:IMP cyclohydrolase